MFSSMNFTVLALRFRSQVHFGLIFVYDDGRIQLIKLHSHSGLKLVTNEIKHLQCEKQFSICNFYITAYTVQSLLKSLYMWVVHQGVNSHNLWVKKYSVVFLYLVIYILIELARTYNKRPTRRTNSGNLNLQA